MSKVVCKLCTGYEDLQSAEGLEEDLLVVDERFFQSRQVRRAFLEYLAKGEVDQDQIRTSYISMYGPVRVRRFERNLQDALMVFERELREALPPAERAAFARVRHDIADAIKSLKADLDASTREMLTSQAQSRQEISEVADGVKRIEDSVRSLSLSQEVDLSGEHQAQLEQARVLLRKFHTRLALEHLRGLKDRIWEEASPADRGAMLALMGFCHLQLGDEPRAAELLIAALDFKPDSGKAMANAALGFLIKSDAERCEKLARDALSRDPLSELASAMLVHASSADEPWEAVVAKVPPIHRETLDVAMALGKVASDRGLLEEAERWYRVAVENNSIDHPDPKGKLAEVLLTRLLDDQPEWPVPGLVQPAASSLQEILTLYDSAWGQVAHTDLRSSRLSFLTNRATVKSLLGDIEGAIHDLDEALSDKPGDSELIRHRALLAYRAGDLAGAAARLREIQDDEECPDGSLWLGLALLEDGREPEAHSLIQAYVEKTDASDLSWKDAVYALVLMELRLGELDEARARAHELREQFPDDPGVLALSARVAHREGQSDEVERLLSDALAGVTPTTRMVTRYRVVDELYANHMFKEAASLLEPMVDTSVDADPTRQLLACYYRAGNLDRALQICSNLRESHGPLRYATAVESAIYEEIGELGRAKQVCKRYLEAFPDDAVVQLRMAAVSYRLKQMDEVDSVLDAKLDIAALSLEARGQLAELHLLRGRLRDALEIAYETRRRFIDRPEAHLAYVNTWITSAENLHDWLQAEAVAVGTAVQLDHPIAGGQRWIVIEDSPDADIARGEFPPSHPLTQLLLDKRKGDSVILSSSMETDAEEYLIEDIRSKFVYAWAQSLDTYRDWFPDSPGIWRGRIEISSDQDASPDRFRSLFEMLDRISERERLAEQLYRDKKCTVGGLAEILGRNPISVRGRLVASPNPGLYCFPGKRQQLEAAVGLLASRPPLIVDITALLTMYELEIGDLVAAEFRGTAVLRSSLELIDGMLAREAMLGKEHLRIGKEGPHYTKTLVTEEIAEQNRKVLESLRAWAESHLRVVSWQAALSVPRDERLQLGRLLGQTFLDTILVAADDNCMLYSDDALLRRAAKSRYQVAGIWSQAVLVHLRERGVINDDDYHEAVIRLACRNYRHTSINSAVLLNAAERAEWRPAFPLLQTMVMLNGSNSELDSAVRVAVGFVYLLWNERLIPDQYELLVSSLLDALTTDRGMNREEAVRKFLAAAERKFALLPQETYRLRRLANAWLRAHVI